MAGAGAQVRGPTQEPLEEAPNRPPHVARLPMPAWARDALLPEAVTMWLTWEVYLPGSRVWAMMPLQETIAWMLGGGLVRCSNG